MGTFRLPSSILLLALPIHDQSHLPVPRRMAGRLLTSARAAHAFRSILESQRNNQVVNEFRSKMRVAEDLISKLTFSLREIQGQRRRKSEVKAAAAPFGLGIDIDIETEITGKSSLRRDNVVRIRESFVESRGD